MSNNSKLAGKLARYSAAAGAAMAVGVNADAQIVHSGSVDSLINGANPMVWIDIDGDGANDFGFSLTTYKYMTSYYNSTMGTTVISTVLTNSYMNNLFGTVGNSLMNFSSETMPMSAASSDMISSGMGFMTFPKMGSYVFYSNQGNVMDQDSALIGFQFQISGSTHYGWMRIHMQSAPFQLEVYDWAYQATAYSPLYAGEVNSPPEAMPGSRPVVPEDTVHALVDVYLGCSDPNMDPVYIIIHQLPTGELFRDGNMNYNIDAGELYTVGDTIPESDIFGSYVLYNPHNDFQGMKVDSFQFKVTDLYDDNDSVYTQYFDILPINDDMYGDVTATNVSCNGLTDGQATAAVKDGVAPYGYQWSTGATTATLNGLAAGVYSCTVSDNYPSTDIVSVTITEPAALTIGTATVNDATCGPDGSITPSVTGGTPPYSYNWNTGVNTANLNNIEAGTYTYIVTDANGCSANSGNITVSGSTVTADAGTDQSVCFGEKVTLKATGGSTYVWSGNITQNTAFAPKKTQTYTVTATDADGCTATDQVKVTVNPLPTVSVGNSVKLICPGDEVSVNATGATTYTWSQGVSNGATVSPSVTTYYTVTGTDAKGCSNTAGLSIFMSENCDGTAGDAKGVIAGALTYSQGTMGAQSALVKLFEKEYYGTKTAFKKLATDTVGENASFFFGSLPEGVYVLKAELLDKASYPTLSNTYYDGLHNWFNADTIMNDGSSIRTINMKMFEIQTEQNGVGRFIGGVYRLSISKDGTATGEPVPGAEIYLEQEPDGDPVGYTISNDQGNYEFSNINQSSSDSSYSLYVNIDGTSEISSYEGMVITETDTLYENLDVIVDTVTQVVGKAGDVQSYVDSVTSVNLYNSPELKINLYPVPSDGPVFAEYTIGNAADVSISLMDAMGNEIDQLFSGQLDAGTYKQQINEGLTAGVYYLCFRIGQTVLVKKILIVN